MVPSPTVPEFLAFRGNLVDAPNYGYISVKLDRLVLVQGSKIVKIASGSEEATVLGIYGVPARAVRRLAVSQKVAQGRWPPCRPLGLPAHQWL
jgi:hypothetical protein